MARTSDIWWRESKGCYFTTLDGKQVRLAKTLKESKTKLQRLLKGEVAAAGDGLTFPALAEKFLDHSQATNAPETYDVHRLFLQSFKDHVGSRKVSRLCEDDLDAWCRRHAKEGGKVRAGGKKGGERDAAPWSENTQARAKAIVLACLNYGVNKLNLPPHPLSKVRPGTVTGRERYLTPEERLKIGSAVKGVFAEYVMALELTGARPFSEVAKLTAADVDLEKGTCTLAKWKNARKQKGKKRVIYLTARTAELLRRLVARHPEGPLFRNQKGTPWSRQSITWRFRALGDRLGIEGLTAYTLRHSYISDALSRGVPVAVVAELCGTSIQTIQKYYNHLNKQDDLLREAARKAIGA